MAASFNPPTKLHVVPSPAKAKHHHVAKMAASGDTEGDATPAGAPTTTKKKMVPPPRSVSIRDLPKRGEANDPFKNNVWKRRMLERWANWQEDVLKACAKGDADAVEQACRELERRNGKFKPALSKDLVGAWTMHWNAGPAAMESLDLFGPGGVSDVIDDRTVKDPFLGIGTRYKVNVAGAAGEVEPTSNTTLQFHNLDGAVPATLKCTYLDVGMWIGRDEANALVVFSRRKTSSASQWLEKQGLGSEQGSLAEYYPGISEAPLLSDEVASKYMATPTLLLAACTVALIAVLMAASAIPSAVASAV